MPETQQKFDTGQLLLLFPKKKRKSNIEEQSSYALQVHTKASSFEFNHGYYFKVLSERKPAKLENSKILMAIKKQNKTWSF